MQRMSTWSSFSGIFLLASLVVGSLGCGSSQPVGEIVKVVPASGILTIRGEPFADYQISTVPSQGRSAVGISDAEGRFVLGTNEPGDGAVTGVHRLSVTWIGPPNPDPNEGIMDVTPPPPAPVETDQKYLSHETSGLSFSIPDAGTSDLKIDLQ